MTRHNPDLGSASDWLKQIFHVAKPIRSTTQIWAVTRHQYGISTLVSMTSFRGKTRGVVAKCQLFSEAINCMACPISFQNYVLISLISATTVSTLANFIELNSLLSLLFYVLKDVLYFTVKHFYFVLFIVSILLSLGKRNTEIYSFIQK